MVPFDRGCRCPVPGHLGIERYGVYETFTGFVVFLGMGNAGLSYGLMNFLTVCFAERDHKKARELISTFLTASIVFAGDAGNSWD